METAFPDTVFAARYHIGDAPADVRAAQIAGSMAIGVATGVFSREELLEAAIENSVVLGGMHDPELVLAALGILAVK